MAANRCSAEKGRKRRTLTRPTDFAAGVEVVDHLFDGLTGRPHGDNHAIGVGIADVVEQVVLRPVSAHTFFM
jgi:hypothetical protein